MITVWCMNTGGHAPPQEVQTLKRMVDRHLSISHEFVCITNEHVDGVDTVKPINDLPGWWGKTNLFAPTVSRRRNLWLDLDVTITGNIDSLCEPLSDFCDIRTCLNWAQSGWGGCQSSVMYWEEDSAEMIYDRFDKKDAHWPPINRPGVLWGDQEHITRLREYGYVDVEYFKQEQVVSYKYHCRQQGLPPESLIQVFHGDPKPSGVSDQWVRDARA